jgi:cytochrome d ubiquinol oxidase subunit II
MFYELSGGLHGAAFWLPLIWAGLIAFAVVMYVILDGFDLGVGILFRPAGRKDWRDRMMLSVAPVWDMNETWLILGGGGLLAVFPLSYALIMPALYIPIFVMLLALIFRGIAFEFRFKAHKSQYLWDASFHYGSVVATFAQGVVLGAFVQGFAVTEGAYVGGRFDWLTPFSILSGFALIAGYALLGATWLVAKTEGELEAWARQRAKRALLFVLAGMAVVSLWVPFLGTEIERRWFSWPNIAFLWPVPILTALTAYGIWRALENERTRTRAFFLSITLFLLGYLGLGISLFPYIVPLDVTIWEASAPTNAQIFALVGASITFPVMFIYNSYTYYVFRGKVQKDLEAAYH